MTFRALRAGKHPAAVTLRTLSRDLATTWHAVVMSARHVVLIRGINVGGKNPVPMAGLRTALEARGFTSVATYIQSGNVALTAATDDEAAVASDVEDVLLHAFGVNTVVVALRAATFADAIGAAPSGFGDDEDTFHHDVVFLRPGVDAGELLGTIRLRQGVDEAWAGQGCLYFRRVSALRTKSYLREIMAMPAYKDMTIRNWRTTTALASLAAGAVPPGTASA